MPLGRKMNWFAKFGRRNHKQAAMRKMQRFSVSFSFTFNFSMGAKTLESKVVFHCILGSGLMDHPSRGTRSSKHRIVDRVQALALLLQRETLGMAILHCCLSLLLPPTSW